MPPGNVGTIPDVFVQDLNRAAKPAIRRLFILEDGTLAAPARCIVEIGKISLNRQGHFLGVQHPDILRPLLGVGVPQPTLITIS